MKQYYIGDFVNPEEEKESWEEYVKRKQREEENQMSTPMKLVLLAIILFALSFLYNYLTEEGN